MVYGPEVHQMTPWRRHPESHGMPWVLIPGMISEVRSSWQMLRRGGGRTGPDEFLSVIDRGHKNPVSFLNFIRSPGMVRVSLFVTGVILCVRIELWYVFRDILLSGHRSGTACT